MVVFVTLGKAITALMTISIVLMILVMVVAGLLPATDGLLVYVAGSEPGAYEARAIYIYDMGRGVVQVLIPPDANHFDTDIADDSHDVLYVSDAGGDAEIYLRRAGERTSVQLTDNNDTDRRPVWSPDGQTILFESNRDGKAELYLMDRTGSVLRQITDNNEYDGQADWSPDGTQIAFVTTRDGAGQIYTLRLDDGSGNRLTTDDNFWHEQPAWSPDGTRIAFVTARGGQGDIYVLELESGELTQMTSYTSSEDMPVWSPDGSRLIFESPRGLWWIYSLRLGDLAAGEQPLSDPQHYLHRLMRPLLTQRLSRYPRTGSIDRLTVSWAR